MNPRGVDTYKDSSGALNDRIFMKMAKQDHSEISLILGGEAGHGLQKIAQILARMFINGGLHVLAVSDYMSRIHGGSNSITMRAAQQPVRALNERIDLCILLDKDSLLRLRGRCTQGAVLVGDPQIFTSETVMLPLPLLELSTKIGGAIYNNSIVCGYIARMIGWSLAPLESALVRIFKDPVRLAKNCAAARLGWAYGAEINGCCGLTIGNTMPDRLLIDGSQAVAFGALAGGCNYISSHPTSPSTGVLTHLAKLAQKHGVVVEQAEDEISAINMGISSWYAGGRAMVSTSGGGFDLMSEGLSLCGAIESPMVIHLAQRPGPGTGMSARTAHGDLEVARYSGQGEFPRAILAPGSPEEAFACAAHAFDMADASQSPIFILTDQYLLNNIYDLHPFILPEVSKESQYKVTEPNYQRYAQSQDVISPRGISGLGSGIVRVDSNECDEAVINNENFEMCATLEDKRLAKMRLLKEDFAVAPNLYGAAEFERLIIGWGSTAAVVAEAMEQLQPDLTAFLHCVQLYPVPQAVIDYLEQATQVIVIENNATGQFARLLQAETGCSVSKAWHKYNGLAFTVDEVVVLLRQEGAL